MLRLDSFHFQFLDNSINILLLEFPDLASPISLRLVILFKDRDEAVKINMRIGYIPFFLIQNIIDVVGEHERIEFAERFKKICDVAVKSEILCDEFVY